MNDRWRRRPLLAAALAVGALIAGCGGGAQRNASSSATPPSTNKASPTTTGLTAGTAPSAGSTSAAAQTGASNLAATADVQAALVAAVATMHHLQPSDYTGLAPGSTYYALDHASGQYWAGAEPVPSPASYEAQVSSQDDGGYIVFNRAPDGSWRGWETGAARGPGARCPVTVPADVLAVWGWAAGTCTPPSTPTSTTVTTTSVLPTASFADWTGRDPSTIAFSGDSSNLVTGLTWSWMATEAVGRGTWIYESCVPNCASGSTAAYPATVTLTDPVGGQFTTGVEQTSGPHGSTYTFTLPSRFIDAS